MDNQKIISELSKERDRLEAIIRSAELRIESAPKGSVRVSPHKKSVQFYQRLDPEDFSGKYIPASERMTAIALIQKKYDQQLLKAAIKQRNAINTFLKDYDINALEQVYRKTGDRRKKFLTTAVLPDEEYKKVWQSFEYEPKMIKEGTAEHYTKKGERVRSKSEVLIADTLDRKGIPYRYECPLQLDERVIHPDFTLLRISDRREVFWEHLGMLDDAEYRNNALSRIRMFERNGILLGDRLILTFETYKYPLNTFYIDTIIKQYLGIE